MIILLTVWSNSLKAEVWELRCGISAMLVIVLWAQSPEDVAVTFTGVGMLQNALVSGAKIAYANTIYT